MATFMTAREFLHFVNKNYCDDNGTVRQIDHAEKAGQKTLPFAVPKQFAWTRKIDMVFIGDCSSEVDFTKGERNFAGRSRIQCMLKENPQTKTIMAFADCCGPYATWYENAIKDAFPDTCWIFPASPDFCRHVWSSHRLVDFIQMLINEDIVKSVKVRKSKINK